MSNVLIGESADMYDPATGRWLGVIDRNGREQFVPSYTDDGNGNNLALPGGVAIPVVAGRALAAADSQNTLRYNSASMGTFTIPSGLPIGFNMAAIQMGAGKITMAAGSGVTLNGPSGLLSTSGQYASIGIIQTAANEYVLTGSLAA